MRTTLYALVILNAVFLLWNWTNSPDTEHSRDRGARETVGLKTLALITEQTSTDDADASGRVDLAMAQEEAVADAAVNEIEDEPVGPGQDDNMQAELNDVIADGGDNEVDGEVTGLGGDEANADTPDVGQTQDVAVLSPDPAETPEISDAVDDRAANEEAATPADPSASEPEAPEPILVAYCARIGPISGQAAAATLFENLSSMIDKPLLTVATEERRPVFWVHIPPFGSVDEAKEVVARLKTRGIESFVITEPEELRNGVSLAVFRTSERSDQMLGELGGLGYEVAVHEKPGTDAEYVIEGQAMVDPEAGDTALLEQLRAAAGETQVELTQCAIAGDTAVE